MTFIPDSSGVKPGVTLTLTLMVIVMPDLIRHSGGLTNSPKPHTRSMAISCSRPPGRYSSPTT